MISEPIRDPVDHLSGDEVDERVARLEPARVRQRLGGLLPGHDLVGSWRPTGGPNRSDVVLGSLGLHPPIA